MTKNTILRLAIIFCEVLRWLTIILGVLLLVAFIHLQINPAFYKDYSLVIQTGGFLNSEYHILENSQIGWTKTTTAFSLSSITGISLYLIFFQMILVLSFWYMIYFEFEKIIKSVKNIQTFQKRNVQSLKKIGKYFILIAIVSFFYFITYCQETQVAETYRTIRGFRTGFNINFTTIFIAIIAFIFAEIFKEGNKLYQENQLTI